MQNTADYFIQYLLLICLKKRILSTNNWLNNIFIALAISYYLGGLGLDEISEEMMTDYSAMAGIANKLGFN